MKIRNIGSRGTLFTFYDLSEEDYESPTNIYLINGNNHLFLCDTFLGPESMVEVKEYMDSHFTAKPIIVFNSHSDWDHHWGNCAFPNSIIIAHRICRDKILEKGEKSLMSLKRYHRGKITITPPNLVFEERISFPDEEVEFFYSPGHTKDSASCIDNRDGVLFAGDNIEQPIPYITDRDLSYYLKTLQDYLNLKIKSIIPGHGNVSDINLLKVNISYLESFTTQANNSYQDKTVKLIHLRNVCTVAEQLKEGKHFAEAVKSYTLARSIADDLGQDKAVQEIQAILTQLQGEE
ncbi:MAG: MBL fold metallo-hydrolase [Candidatus Odinarchaeota archaeon]